jgi:hypothetical protein
MEIEIVNFGLGKLGYVADIDTLCYTVVSLHFLCYGGTECLAILL